jgi:hypothetical protein
MQRNAHRVAVIGAGPAGLVAARFLKGQGFTPVLIDRATGVGGQWDSTAARTSVWPSLRTNTNRTLTRFSDLDYPAGIAVFPRNQEVLAYLESYARRFDLAAGAHFGSTVELVARNPRGGYDVTSSTASGQRRTEWYRYVVVATGRCAIPRHPAIPGLPDFSGPAGVMHSYDYKGPDAFRGLEVLVAGANISALEIATELAAGGAAAVAVAQRRPRYILPKLIAGVPADTAAFTRFGALAGESLPPDAVAAALKRFVLSAAGHPSAYGAPAPAENVFEAGIALSHNFLPMVADGRIAAKPWISRVEGREVRFADGTSQAFDAIVLGTGYRLALPFLDRGIAETLRLDDRRMDAAHYVLNPDLPGLAFLGLINQAGPYFPVLELQARYLAYAWGGAIGMPSDKELRAAIEADRDAPPEVPMHAMALRYARLIGAEPRLSRRPGLARALLFGPLTATSFRLDGPDALHEAEEVVAREAGLFDAVSGPDFTPAERAQLAALAQARRDAELAALAGDEAFPIAA